MGSHFPSMPLEGELTRRFLSEMKRSGLPHLARKINDGTTAGIPDTLIFTPAAVIVLEMKRATTLQAAYAKVSERQKITLRALAQIGSVLAGLCVFHPDGSVTVEWWPPKGAQPIAKTYPSTQAAARDVLLTGAWTTGGAAYDHAVEQRERDARRKAAQADAKVHKIKLALAAAAQRWRMRAAQGKIGSMERCADTVDRILRRY